MTVLLADGFPLSGTMHVLVDRCDLMCADERVTTEGSAVDATNCNRRCVRFLNRQFQVEELQHAGKVWILLCILNDARAENISGAFYVYPGLVDAHEVNSFQIPKSPEKHFDPESSQMGSNVARNWKNYRQLNVICERDENLNIRMN